MTILLAVAVTALVAASIALLYAARALATPRIEPSLPIAHPEPTPQPEMGRAEIEGEFNHLRLAIAEGIERTDRAEKRIRKTVTSARKLLREAGLEHAGLEAEASEIRERDDEGIEPLPAVLPDLEGTRTVRIPGGSLTIPRRTG